MMVLFIGLLPTVAIDKPILTLSLIVQFVLLLIGLIMIPFVRGEAIPARQKKIMGMCMAAYDRVGIIRNVIDLMSDFASQGLVLVHPNRQIEKKFYRKWFSEINAIDRSERFLNYLYRCGNVVVQRRTAKLSKKHEQELKKSCWRRYCYSRFKSST